MDVSRHVNKPSESSLAVLEEDPLQEIADDGGLKSTFQTTTLPVVWIYPEIAIKTLITLLEIKGTFSF